MCYLNPLAFDSSTDALKNLCKASKASVKGSAPDILLQFSVRSEMVDFGSGQGRSDVETAGVAQRYVEEFSRARTPAWAKRCPF
jgi:hypothetical protein